MSFLGFPQPNAFYDECLAARGQTDGEWFTSACDSTISYVCEVKHGKPPRPPTRATVRPKPTRCPYGFDYVGDARLCLQVSQLLSYDEKAFFVYRPETTDFCVFMFLKVFAEFTATFFNFFGNIHEPDK